MFQNKIFTIDVMNRTAIAMSLIDSDHNRFNQESGDYNNDVIDQVLRENGFEFVQREDFDRNTFESSVNSGVPFMCIITQDTHHYSARRFSQDSCIWIFDSKLPFPVMDSSILEKQLLFNILKHFDHGHIQRVPQILLVLNSGKAASVVVPEFKIYNSLTRIEYSLPFLADPQLTVLHRPNQCSVVTKIQPIKVYKFKKPSNLNSQCSKNKVETLSKISSIKITKLTTEQVKERNRISHLEKYKLAKSKRLFKHPSFFSKCKNSFSIVNSLNNIYQKQIFSNDNFIFSIQNDSNDANSTTNMAILLSFLKENAFNIRMPTSECLQNIVGSKEIFVAIFVYNQLFYSVIRFDFDESIWIFDTSLEDPFVDQTTATNSIILALSYSPMHLKNTVLLDINSLQETSYVERAIEPLNIYSTNSPLKPLLREYEQPLNTKIRAPARLSDQKRMHDWSINYKSNEKLKSHRDISIANNFIIIPCFFEKQNSQGEFCGVNAINNLFQYNIVQNNTMINFGIGKSKLPAHKGIELFRYKNPRGKFHSSLLLMYIEEVLKCKTKTFHRKNHFDEKLVSKEPLMLLITQYDHHYSARRFEKDGDLFIFDSLHPFSRGITDKENKLLTCLSYQMENNIQKPIVLQVEATLETPLRNFESVYVNYDCSKELKKPKVFKFRFENDVPLSFKSNIDSRSFVKSCDPVPINMEFSNTNNPINSISLSPVKNQFRNNEISDFQVM
jgi:hypothetical protein